MSLILREKIVPQLDEAGSRKAESMRTLVVDDDNVTLDVVSQMMEALGFCADKANGGIAAIRCLTQFRYDLVLTDFNMPDMDGYALAGWLKHESKYTSVIIMTGCSPSEVETITDTPV